MTIHIAIQRDLGAGPHKSGRFRVAVATSAGGPPLLISARYSGSVAKAKMLAEEVFGELTWQDAPIGNAVQAGDVTRSTAAVEFD